MNLDVLNPGYQALRWRSKPVWSDPVRKVRTLESFAKTETDGGHDIAAALELVADPELRQHLDRHAREELHHGHLFTDRAAALRAQLGVAATDEAELDKPFDLTRGREAEELDAHGFMRGSLFEEMGEIAYVAMLHVAEKKAAFLFRVHRDLTRDDPETCAIFEEILRDEKYHVAYTGRFLDQWRRQGRGTEVRDALDKAKGSRLLAAWKRAGVRAGGHASRLLLLVLYCTLLAPFGLIARFVRDQAGWHSPTVVPGGGEQTRSQY